MYSRRILQQPLRAAITRVPVLNRFSVRNASTTANANTWAQPSRWTRRPNLRWYIRNPLAWVLGNGWTSKFAEPPLPGTIEDQVELEHIQRAYEIGLPIVQQLRQDPDFTEKEVYENFSDDHKTHRLTSGPLAGSRGLGLQVSSVLGFRIFCPRRERTSSQKFGRARSASTDMLRVPTLWIPFLANLFCA